MKTNLTAFGAAIGLGLCLWGSCLPVLAEPYEVIKAEPHDYAPKFDQEDPPEEKPQVDFTVAERPAPQVGKVYQELYGDLDRDGHTERVALIPFQVEQDNTFMQLVVFNDKDQEIWRTPRLTDPENKRTFGQFVYGNFEMQLLCDLDKDGYMDLIFSTPRSDVRPMPYRVFKWDGDKFVYAFDGALERSKDDKELFLWNTKGWDGIEGVCWLDGIHEENGQIKSRIISCEKGYKIKEGEAFFKITNKRGFRVTRWTKHLLDVKF
ncbi:MAG: hypothetical protein Q4F00_01930 [bacterium]|nr:hypothetical protein [bacterium]